MSSEWTIEKETTENDLNSDPSWDVIVIGAGVAGASAAILSARAGYKTLIVDAKKFPREKVCGGCLNHRAQESLKRLGVYHSLMELGALQLSELHLKIRRTEAVWPIPTIVSVRRSTLDSHLVQTAVKEGATFFPETQATLVAERLPMDESSRTVQLSKGNVEISLTARCVLIADGLTRSSLRRDVGWETNVATASRIGVQAIVAKSTFPHWNSHRLTMLVGNHGYVGFSEVDGDKIDVAAAIDPGILRKGFGPLEAILKIIEECGADKLNGIAANDWLATPLLTRSSRQIAARRVFLLGDAIGYVEPFTGEGMSWALASAEAIIPIVQRTMSGWNENLANEWNESVRQKTKSNQRVCRFLSYCLRYPRLSAWMIFGCRWLPPLQRELMRRASE